MTTTGCFRSAWGPRLPVHLAKLRLDRGSRRPFDQLKAGWSKANAVSEFIQQFRRRA
jgi:hypothetical protein